MINILVLDNFIYISACNNYPIAHNHFSDATFIKNKNHICR